MSISFTCPACRFTFRSGKEWAGRKTKCPRCLEEIRLPQPRRLSFVPPLLTTLVLLIPVAGMSGYLIRGNREVREAKAAIEAANKQWAVSQAAAQQTCAEATAKESKQLEEIQAEKKRVMQERFQLEQAREKLGADEQARRDQMAKEAAEVKKQEALTAERMVQEEKNAEKEKQEDEDKLKKELSETAYVALVEYIRSGETSEVREARASGLLMVRGFHIECDNGTLTKETAKKIEQHFVARDWKEATRVVYLGGGTGFPLALKVK